MRYKVVNTFDNPAPGFELSIPVKKSQTTVSMTERNFILSAVVWVVVECTRKQCKGN